MAIGNNRILFVLVITFSLFSCGRNVVFTDSEAMPGKTWELSKVPVFDIPVDDTISDNNISFTIRTSSSYPYRNIFLFVATTSPEGRTITDTLEYKLADESGNWLGKGFGDIHELKLPYKSAVFFPVKGNYTISVQHGMRMEDLRGVYDFGLRVEKNVK